VLIGFVGTAYLTFLLLVFRFWMGFTEECGLEESDAKNPIDSAFLEWIWRFFPQPSEKWVPAVRSVRFPISSMSNSFNVSHRLLVYFGDE
jgi:hypothetical protein